MLVDLLQTETIKKIWISHIRDGKKVLQLLENQKEEEKEEKYNVGLFLPLL